MQESILIVLHTFGRVDIEKMMLELRKRGQFPAWDVLVETVLAMVKGGKVRRFSGVMNTIEYGVAE